MKCTQARDILSHAPEKDASGPEYRQARQHVATCPKCQAGLARLATAVQEWARQCAQLEELLPIYVEDELAGLPARERYPGLAEHLDICPSCNQAYAELRDMLLAERQGAWTEPAAYPTFDLPFLAPTPPHRPGWLMEMVRDAGGRLLARLTIRRATLADSLFPQPLAWARAADTDETPQEPVSVLHTWIDTETRSAPLLLTVDAERESGNAETWRLRISLTGPKGTGRGEASLTAGGQRRAASLDEQGEALFGSMPLSWLSAETSGEDLQIDLPVET